VYKARCQFGANWELYWTEPRFLYQLSQEQAVRMIVRRSGQEPIPLIELKSEKEKLIDSLRSGYKYERMWATKEVGSQKDVDDQVIHILKEMSVDDPEPEVREAAGEALRQFA